MKFTPQDKPCLPVGAYVGRFVGVVPQDTSSPTWRPSVGNDGNPLPPGIIWSWEVIGGPHDGQLADRMTGKAPTLKSTCAAVLSALFERPVRIGEELDTDALIGTLWRFHVVNKDRGSGTTVAIQGLVRARDLERKQPTAGKPPAAADLPGPPPDEDDGGGELKDESQPCWWIRRGKGLPPELVNLAELTEFVRAGADPSKDKCCPAGGKKWVKIGEAVPELANVKPIL